MTSRRVQQEIERRIAAHPTKRSACIEALQVAQEEEGWICDDTLAEVARLLDMTPAELDEVATFYSLIYRKPVGVHRIHLCESISCWIMGADALRHHLEERLAVKLGEITKDSLFTVLPIPCLGACDHAPVALIDGEITHDLTPRALDAVIHAVEEE
jgi:NADH-quinone oxidoreductase subunit E